MNVDNLTNIGNNFLDSYSITKKEKIESDNFQKMLDKAIEEKDDKKLKESCNTFESYFLQMMFKSMKSVSFADEDSVFAKSNAQKIFEDMFEQQICNIAANSNNGIGLSKMLYERLSKDNSSNV